MTCVAAACLSRALFQSASVSRCGSVAFREMCSVGDAKALLERLAEYAQPPSLRWKGLCFRSQRVRLCGLFGARSWKGAPTVAKRPKLAASEDDALQKPTDAEPASVRAQDDGSDDYCGMTPIQAGMAPPGISRPGMLQVAMVSGMGPTLCLLQWTLPVPCVLGFSSRRAVVRNRILLQFLLLQMLLRRLRTTTLGTCQKCPLRMMTLLPLLRVVLVINRQKNAQMPLLLAAVFRSEWLEL